MSRLGYMRRTWFMLAMLNLVGVIVGRGWWYTLASVVTLGVYLWTTSQAIEDDRLEQRRYTMLQKRYNDLQFRTFTREHDRGRI